MVAPIENNDRILFAVAIRLASAALFSSMTALIKLAEAGGAHLAEVLFFRQTFALPLVALWIAMGPGLGSIRTRRFGAHVSRTVIGLLSMCFMFSTILLLPLAESTTMQFTLPIFATILGALILREPTGWHRWAAVIAGFIGVLIVTQPGTGHIASLGIVTGLLAGLLSASVSILLRQISRTESAATIVFWFSTLSIPPLGIAFALFWQPHSLSTWLLLVAVGLTGGAAQLCMTAALRAGPVSLVVPMDYTGLIWAALYGWLLFGALPDAATWLGAPVIIASGLYIVWREHRLHRERTDRAVAQG